MRYALASLRACLTSLIIPILVPRSAFIDTVICSWSSGDILFRSADT